MPVGEDFALDYERRFVKAMKRKFEEDPKDKIQTHIGMGIEQSERKKEFRDAGKKIAEERGISGYDPMLHLGGIPLGQRVLMPYKLSTTDSYCEGDDLHFVNNAAMQQFWDDIRRTTIVGLDMAHSVLERRLGKEVTPETINEYLHMLNHAMPGAAVVQEHMVETNPGLVDDCYVKIFTGDDELADEIDDQYLIDINKLFTEDHAKQLKEAIGKSLWQAVHIPTIVCRTCDGATTKRWSAMQISMAMIDAYHLCAGEAAISDFAYASKHAAAIDMASFLPARRARGENEPGGLQFGLLGDIVQANRIYPDDPARASLEVVAAGVMLYDQIWLGSYMSGGVGFTQYSTAAYTDDILDDYTYYGVDYINKKYGGIGKAPATMDTVIDVGTEVTLYAMEQLDSYPTLMEDHFGGSQRCGVGAAGTAISCSLATGHAQAGLNGWYLHMILHKEKHGRLGFYGYDLQDQCGSANSFSIRGDEGAPLELRGPNYPNYAMNVGHMGEYAGISAAAHYALGDAYVLNPLVKVAFADPSLKFDYSKVRKEYAKGALREFSPAGERSLIIPAK